MLEMNSNPDTQQSDEKPRISIGANFTPKKSTYMSNVLNNLMFEASDF